MLEIGSALDPGRRLRAKKNQDTLCILQPGPSNLQPPLLLVADGMGGYEGGAVASHIIAASFADVYHHAAPDAEPLAILRAGIFESLKMLRKRAFADESLSRMGSTVVAALPLAHSIALVNVGDSRAYLVNKDQVRQLSYDHSVVGEQLRMGYITEEQLRSHPRRNVLNMSISAQRQEIDVFAAEFDWEPGDCLVLCSDGLWGPVVEAQIQSVVIELAPQQAADRLVELANFNLGPDNIAVIVASNH